VVGGLPRGRISEITGSASSGRTTLLDSVLAAAANRNEQCALVDTRDTFDPPSAAARGVALARLLWVRCNGSVPHALRAADLLLLNGGFGIVALDLAGVAPAMLDRIPPAYWFRFRRAVESTPAVFVVVADRPLARSAGSLLVEARRRHTVLRAGPAAGQGAHTTLLLRDVAFEAIARKPVGKEPVAFHVRVHPLGA
jgi:hypothetical protein